MSIYDELEQVTEAERQRLIEVQEQIEPLEKEVGQLRRLIKAKKRQYLIESGYTNEVLDALKSGRKVWAVPSASYHDPDPVRYLKFEGDPQDYEADDGTTIWEDFCFLLDYEIIEPSEILHGKQFYQLAKDVSK